MPSLEVINDRHFETNTGSLDAALTVGESRAYALIRPDEILLYA